MVILLLDFSRPVERMNCAFTVALHKHAAVPEHPRLLLSPETPLSTIDHRDSFASEHRMSFCPQAMPINQMVEVLYSQLPIVVAGALKSFQWHSALLIGLGSAKSNIRAVQREGF